MRNLPFILFLFFSSCYWGVAQDKISADYSAVPLKEIIKDLESKSALYFSYSEDVIADKTVSIRFEHLETDQILELLTTETGLVFERVSDTDIIITLPTLSMDICAYIHERPTGKPLEGVTVTISGSARGSISDNNGYFEFKAVPIGSEIRLAHLGYRDLVIVVGDVSLSDCPILFLEPGLETLNEVVVTSYLTKGVDKNSDGSFSLTNNRLGVLAGLVEPDVFQNIQNLPGITSLDESAAGIQIRGGSPDQNLVIVDNIKMYNTGHFFDLISAINPYLIEGARIYKGGASPKYGDRVSGVIDIFSDRAVPQKTTGGLGINGTHGDAFLKTPLGKHVGLLISGRHSYSNIFQTPTFNVLSNKVFQNETLVTDAAGGIFEQSEDRAIKDDFFFYDSHAKLLFQPGKQDTISVSGIITKNDLDFVVQSDEDLVSDRLIIENQGVGFSWEGTRTKWFNHSLSAYYSSLDSSYKNEISEEAVLEEESFRSNTVEDYGLGLDLAFGLSGHHWLHSGFQWSNTNASFQFTRTESNDENEIPENSATERNGEFSAHAAYLEYQYKPDSKAVFNAGIRVSKYSILDGIFWEPRLNLELPIFDQNLRFKITFENRYQPISQLIEFEDSQTRLENKVWTVSNGEDFPLLKSTQFSAGLLLSKGGWTFELDGYRKQLDGLTSFTNGFTNLVEDYSEGESTIMGIDMFLQRKFKNYSLVLGYTFNDVEYTFEELQDGSFPGNNDVPSNFSISNIFEKDNWEFALGWTIRSGAPYTPSTSLDDENEIGFGAINSLRLPGYHRLDASLRYGFSFSSSSKTKGAIGLSVLNIYDRRVPLFVSYRVDDDPVTDEQQVTLIEQLSQGLTPNISLRINFE
ncbi:TonB-dependent receptor [Flagellimonas algicola]|uniref:Secretin/TonB short N-terminal domain-containing protein n=1 Tax=Flagellimonas algicola TaxID=2583815 RepID=A0ABY2WIG9_9FLAO|nr:TonB-dependent receptor [Allomuricauda algicola]TMU54626.1 hypothetical protein FGG15_10475 [Allomuricauda algicola]